MSIDEEIPPTLADYKAWLTRKYPTRKWVLDISHETYRMLRDNQLAKLEKP
jgi:hypothetical protein